jgi:signal transduction histidine kinase
MVDDPLPCKNPLMRESSWQRRMPCADAGVIDALVLSEQRLAVVHGTGLLDSEAEESFDVLTRLAARLLDVPAAFVSIVDADRDFYKSQVGFPPEIARERALSGRSFCHYTLEGGTPLVIDDTHSHPVWRAVPTVDTVGVRAYVGVPLRIGPHTIGSFCVVDMKPRAWTAQELETIEQLAISAAREISLRAALAAAQGEAATSHALVRAREEMVAVVAHDIRTPLQILGIGTQMIRHALAGEHHVTTGRMLRAVDAMTAMADSLLSSAALMAPSAAGRQLFDGAELARDAVHMMTPIAERAGIVLVLGEVPAAVLRIDYAQLLRVLGNLVGNAIKYSPPGSTVIVCGSRADAALMLEVRDNGKGMTADEKVHAFERGWQGGPGMARGDGAGLGLSIAQTLVEQHGGTVTFGTVPGAGTTLVVTLPCVARDGH